jgi:hypothetical protein
VAVFSGMLGVTMFGLALTPVFFSTIDWLSETPLFASSRLRRISDIAMDILSMRQVRHFSVKMKNRFVRPSMRTSVSPKVNSNATEISHDEVSQDFVPHITGKSRTEGPELAEALHDSVEN